MWGLPSSALQGLSLSRVMVTYVVLQFLLWAVHDGLQQLMFEQPGFAPFGTTMALFLQTTCVVGSLLEGALSRLVPAPDPPKPANKPRSSEAAPPAGVKAGGGAALAKPAEAAAASTSAAPLPHLWWREAALGVTGSYLLLGLMISLSAGLANGSLAFVSQPVKVLFKSSKVLPVMFFRAILGNSGANGWADYAYALMLAGGLTLFSASDVANTSSRGSNLAHQLLGMAMLIGSVCCDAIAPNLQERLLRKLGQPKTAVVLNTNALSAALTAAVWVPSGEAVAVRAWFANHRSALRLLLAQSVAGYFGVLAYLGCIRHAGSKATVLVTTARKMVTILLSYWLFTTSGAFTLKHALGLTLAVVGMTGSSLREAVQMKSEAVAAAAAATMEKQGADAGGTVMDEIAGSPCEAPYADVDGVPLSVPAGAGDVEAANGGHGPPGVSSATVMRRQLAASQPMHRRSNGASVDNLAAMAPSGAS